MLHIVIYNSSIVKSKIAAEKPGIKDKKSEVEGHQK